MANVKSSETKEIKCANASCKNTFKVFKWSLNKQRCEKCKTKKAKASTEENLVSAANNVLSSVEFTLASDGWYKLYSDSNTVYRVEPKFDKGISVDKRYDIIGFIIHKQEYVEAASINNKNIPKEMYEDMSKIVNELSQYTIKRTDSAVDMVQCDICHDKVAEWMEIKDKYICAKKCLSKRMKR
jgi:hypothetical protein